MLPTLVSARRRAARVAAVAITLSMPLALGASAAPAGAAPISLVKTINTTTADAGPDNGVVKLGANGYFLAQSSESTVVTGLSDLYKVDGTTGAVTLVKTLPKVFAESFQGDDLTLVGSTLYFTRTTSGAASTTLWKSDGTTAGTTQVAWSPSSGSQTSGLAIAGVVGTKLYLTANAGSVTDSSSTLYALPEGGTTATTLVTGPLAGSMQNLTAATGGLAYFTRATDTASELWRTDGTAVGTTKLHTGPAVGGLTELVTVGSRLYFGQGDSATSLPNLWTSDGTTGGTVQVTFPASPTAPRFVDRYLATSDALYVIGTRQESPDDPNGTPTAPIWKIQGTTTTQVTDDAAQPSPVPAAAIGTTLYFTAGEDSRELWKTTGGTTTQVTTHAPTDTTANVFVVGASATTVYYTDHGSELWATSGTGNGTKLLDAYGQVERPTGGSSFDTIGSATYFTNRTALYGAELWSTGGTAATTHLAKDVNTQARDANVRNAVSVGGTVYFTATDGAQSGGQPSTELWKSDGTGAGTSLVAHLDVDGRGSYVSRIVPAGGGIVVVAGNGLWSSDGTGAGTRLITPTTGTENGFYAMDAEAFGARVAFTGPGATTDLALWTTDGTDAGTHRVADLPSRPTDNEDDDYEPFYTAAGSQLYFLGYDAAHGYELWHSDGTTAGTALVKDLAPGAADDIATVITPAGDHVVFAAKDAKGQQQIWQSNAAGTDAAALTDVAFASAPSIIVPTADGIYVAAQDMLWTIGGKQPVCGPAQTGAAPTVVKAPGPITALVPFGHGVAFADITGGVSASDGTAAGTTLLHQASAGSFGDLVSLPSGLWFAHSATDTGVELWHSEGTAATTSLVADFAPGAASSRPESFAVAGNMLVFAAGDGTHGRQLAATALGAPLSFPVAAAACPAAPATTPTPAAPTATQTPKPPVATPAPKLAPKAFTLKLASKTDKKAPYKYTFSGVLTLPAGAVLKDACAGTVVVQIKRGKKLVATKSIALKVSGSTCVYKVAVKVPTKKLARKGSLKATVTFQGSAKLAAAKTPKAVTLKYGR